MDYVREREKSAILECLDILNNLQESRQKNYQDSAGVSDLVAICSETAQSLRDILQREDEEAYLCLAAYCNELLTWNVNKENTGTRLITLLHHAKHAVLRIKCKLEVVFLPYKFSMWDCMESIWNAAAKDEECDAVVVPIPYYDRNKDFSLGQYHYEGRFYPDYIQIVDYRDYNIEERHPDIIFIHNPYDQYNLATSVDPMFYMPNLKKHTGCLAYIDYGLPLWVHRTPDSNKFIIPSWIYPDIFFTFSKEYAKDMEYNARQLIPGASVEFVAMGSPKFDKMLHSSKENYELPYKWSQRIANRKVVLLGTSVGAVLNEENYLDHLNDIFDVFRTYDEVALWWRPHPLFAQVLHSMRPHLVQKYSALVEEYLNADFGIYDDSGELHRSIVYADAYYGDASSLAYFFLAEGKPLSIRGHSFPNCYFTDNQTDFSRALAWRIDNMRQAKGANINNYNVCIDWNNFYDDLSPKKYLQLFLDYVAHPEQYQDDEIYRSLEIKMFRDFVINFDGTAGEKIYTYCKNKCMSGMGGRRK